MNALMLIATNKVRSCIILLGVSFLLAACGGRGEAPPPTAQPEAPSTPVDQASAEQDAMREPTQNEAMLIAEATFPGFPGTEGTVYGACAANNAELNNCPVAERLRQRLSDLTVTICRCQNGTDSREIEVDTYPGGATAHVTMWQGSVTFELKMVIVDDQLLVDDQTCAGDPATSIYNDPVGPCSNEEEQAQAPESPGFYEKFLASQGLTLARDLQHADVTGDGVPEVLINAQIEGCGSCHGRTLFVMSGSEPIFQAEGEGWLTSLDSGSSFQWTAPLRLPADAACCPSWFFVKTFDWQAPGFQMSPSVGLQHFAALNQQPIPDPLEPPVQVATAVLYYTLLAQEHFAQAYELLSQELRGEQPFDSWRAGFSTTESVFVEAAAYDGPTGRVDVRFEAMDRTPDGSTSTTVYEGTWSLVEENGSWKLDGASISALSQ